MLRASIAHRLRRGALALDVLKAQCPGTAAALVPAVYTDVSAARRVVAERSLLAHLLKLRDDGAQTEIAGVWSAREAESL